MRTDEERKLRADLERMSGFISSLCASTCCLGGESCDADCTYAQDVSAAEWEKMQAARYALTGKRQ